MLYKWLFVIWLFAIANKPLHPLFVSVTEIEHNANEKSMEISCKIFTDDFEKTLRKEFTGKVDLLNPAMKSSMNALVNNYVNKHLQINVNDQKVTLQFVGFEQQEEAIISYYQVGNIASVKKLIVTNNILYEYSKQQMGIIHAFVKGERKSTKLDNPNAVATFNF